MYIMWILFGTNYNTVEQEPQVYFIGAFDNYELANQERNKSIIELLCNKHDIFIKKVEINQVHDIYWSNCCD
jgi:hypothetical protein